MATSSTTWPAWPAGSCAAAGNRAGVAQPAPGVDVSSRGGGEDEGGGHHRLEWGTVWKVADPKNGKDFLIPLDGPIGEVVNRRLAQVGGTGPLFWNVILGDDYPRQLKDANRELRELTQLWDIRPHDLRRTGRTHISGLGNPG